jgi:hypothetical protein
VTKTSALSWDTVKGWYDSAGRGLEDHTVVVTLEATSRQQKMTATRQLEELIVDSVVEDEGGCAVWESFGYCFKFLARKYSWNNQDIYITANEALFLYRWLVLHDDICKMQMYYLRNMRKRLGKAFLAEVAE